MSHLMYGRAPVLILPGGRRVDLADERIDHFTLEWPLVASSDGPVESTGQITFKARIEVKWL